MKIFEPQPTTAIHCSSDGCGKKVIGYLHSRTGMSSGILCEDCAENEWHINLSKHNRLMAANRSSIGDEAFVKLVFPDATVEPSGLQSLYPWQFYILTFMDTSETGSSGYAETPELAWTQMADKIDKHMREPYRPPAPYLLSLASELPASHKGKRD